MPTFALLTSGGDAPGMNAALHAAVKLCARLGARALGVEEGYEGLMAGRLVPLGLRDVDAIAALGGTILGSARSAAFRTPAGRRAAAAALAGVDGLVVIGGNGSLAGAAALHREHGVPVVGVPASIDNDIGCTTSAIGVDTALNTIVAACDRISDTARAHRRVFVVEVMGRDCGYLAMAAAAAAGADAVLSREQGRSEDEIVDRLDAVVRDGLAPERGKRRVLVIKAEGVEVETAALVRRLQERVDRHTPGVDVRGTVLGHLVRGGSPSFHDRLIAGRLAVAAIDALRTGHAGEMAAWQPWLPGRDSVDPSVRMHPLEQVADETARLLDGTSPLARGRIDLLTRYEDVLAL